MERLNGEIRDREKVMRSLKKESTPVLVGYRVFSQLRTTTHGLRRTDTCRSSWHPNQRIKQVANADTERIKTGILVPPPRPPDGPSATPGGGFKYALCTRILLWYDLGTIKFSVSMTPQLHSALTNAALDHNTNLSREIENFLRENATVQKYLAEVRAEPDEGALAINPKTMQAKETRAIISA